MKRIFVVAVSFLAGVIVTWVGMLILAKSRSAKEAVGPSYPSTQSPAPTPHGATTVVNPEDLKANGIVPQNSKPMTRAQWSAFLTYDKNEISFQDFEKSNEYAGELHELQAIASRTANAGSLAPDDVDHIRVYLHHRYYGFRAAALQVVEKAANTEQVKAALYVDVSHLLEDVSPTVRQAAIAAAVAIKGWGAVPLLTQRVRTDPEPTVQKMAQKAIQTLSRTPQSPTH
jgi:hypothetical protein